MKNQILKTLKSRNKSGVKSFAVLIDPDEISDLQNFQKTINLCIENRVDFFLVGGSLITTNNLHQIVVTIKANSSIPAILFPGNNMQIDTSADAILLLSLISGRNADLLIGQHVIAAPALKKSNLEIMSTGYILVDSGNKTTVSYVSQTLPIPSDKPAVAASTAIAGEMLGLKLIYLEAGSGANMPVSPDLIYRVRRSVKVPLIVGGGIDSTAKANQALEAGADMIVVGNGIEKDQNLITEVAEAVIDFNLHIHK